MLTQEQWEEKLGQAYQVIGAMAYAMDEKIVLAEGDIEKALDYFSDDTAFDPNFFVCLAK